MTKLIVDFLGYQLNEEDINQIIDSLPKREKSDDGKVNQVKNSVKQSQFQGVIGDWQNYLSPEQSRKMDELFKARFSNLGLTMSFDSMDALKRFQQFGRIIVDNKSKNDAKSKVKKAETPTSDKPEFTKDEVMLLRQKSSNKIEMFALESNSTQNEDGCCTSFLKMFCPCFYT